MIGQPVATGSIAAQGNPASGESWRDIPGFPDYQASDLGRIRSRKSGDWYVLHPTPHQMTGYLVVSPRVGGKYVARSVHRLVATTFLGAANGRDVNHRNGDKHDNSLRNLEYLSRGENHRHAYRTGLRPPVGRKLTNEQVRRIAGLQGAVSQKDIARQFGVSCTTVNRIHNRQAHAALFN